MFLVYFSNEARATEYLFKLPRVRVAVLSIPTAILHTNKTVFIQVSPRAAV